MNVGLALSGGGIRGIAHAGVIKALEEKNIETLNRTIMQLKIKKDK